MVPAPMFPLGLALLPGAVLPLHVFEPRYRRMIGDLLARDDDMEFGVVLIERGRESGGGETRSEVGTFARVLDLRVLEDGRYTLITVGTDRFEVVGWLPDDPYPVARVRRLVDVPPSIPVDGEALIARAVDLARRAGHEIEHPGETAVCPTFVAGAIAPIAEVDRQRLLRLPDPGERAVAIGEALDDLEAVLRFSQE